MLSIHDRVPFKWKKSQQKTKEIETQITNAPDTELDKTITENKVIKSYVLEWNGEAWYYEDRSD